MSYLFGSSSVEQKAASTLAVIGLFIGLAIVGVAILKVKDLFESIANCFGSFFKSQKN